MIKFEKCNFHIHGGVLISIVLIIAIVFIIVQYKGGVWKDFFLFIKTNSNKGGEYWIIMKY